MPEGTPNLDAGRRRFAAFIGLFSLVFALFPLGLSVWHDSHTRGLTPIFVAQNLSDASVYFAWIRQAADGGFLTRNLFAPGGPENHTVYLLFWSLGLAMSAVRMDLAPFYGLATVAAAATLLSSLWWFVGIFLKDGRLRLVSFSVICLSSGIGWVFALFGTIEDNLPIDFQQPEAITFVSLRTPLFAFSQAMMLVVLGNLWMGQRDRSWKPVLIAAVCSALLANSHTYDIISLGAVWIVWILLCTWSSRKLDTLAICQALVVGTCALIPAVLNFEALKATGALEARQAAPTPAHTIWLNLAGFGLLLPLAWVGLKTWTSEVEAETRLWPSPRWLLLTWATLPVALQYLPTSFQRKLIMGVHIPLALLAGIGIIYCTKLVATRFRWLSFAALVSVLSLTNVSIVWQETIGALNPDAVGLERPTLLNAEASSMRWLNDHAEKNAIVQALPNYVRSHTADDWDLSESSAMLLIPSQTRHSEQCGHWCESPNFEKKMDEWQTFAERNTDDKWRASVLSHYQIQYLMISHRDCPDDPDLVFGTWRTSAPSFLEKIPEGSNPEVDLYRVRL